MTQSFTTQSLASLFGFPFKDPRWRSKLLTGGIIIVVSPFLLFLPSFLVAGYGFRMMRRVINEHEEPSLPEWTDWQGLFLDGIRFSAVWQVYFLPILILMGFALIMMMIPAMAAGLLQEAGDQYSFLFFFSTMIGPLLMMFVSFLAIVLNFFIVVASSHMVARDSFAAAFRIGDWWPVLRANLGGFLISSLLTMALGYALSLVYQLLVATLVLCVLAPVVLLLASFYQSLISYALFALAYREGLDRRNSLSGQMG
jgi:hypothetical protein